MTVADLIYREMVRPNRGVRVPTFPERRRTALLSQNIPTDISVGTGSVGTANVVLLRDPNFPLWGTQAKAIAYSAGWTGRVQAATYGFGATETYTDEQPELSVTNGTLATNPQLYTHTFSSAPEGVSGGGTPIGVFDDKDKPYLWVPRGATTLLGCSFQTTLATGVIQVSVEIERRLDATRVDDDYTFTFANLSTTAGTQSLSANVFINVPSDVQGVWVRVKTFSVLAGGTGATLSAAWQPYCCITVAQNLNIPALPTPINTPFFPTITSTTNITAGYLNPLVCTFAERGATTTMATQIANACKIVGCALTLMNVTAVSNIEGTLRAARFIEGVNSLARLPTDSEYGRILPEDKYSGRMANGVYTFVRPGPEFKFMKTIITIADPLNIQAIEPVAVPVLTMLPGMNYNLIRLTDSNVSTVSTLMAELRYSLEFVTTDVLLQPRPAAGVIHDTEAAIIRIERSKVFMPAQAAATALVDTRSYGMKVMREVRGSSQQQRRPRRRQQAPARPVQGRQPPRRAPKPAAKPPARKLASGLDLYMQSKRK